MEGFFFTFTEIFRLKKYFFIFLSVCCSSFVSAQVTDSAKAPVKSIPVEYFQEKDVFLNTPAYRSIDTSMDGIQKYFPNTFPYSLGLSNRKMTFEPSPTIGFRTGLDDLDLFGYKKDETKYYHTRTPYTEVNVLFGMKKEQYSRLLHTQNITKQWNIFFERQVTSTTSLMSEPRSFMTPVCNLYCGRAHLIAGGRR